MPSSSQASAPSAATRPFAPSARECTGASSTRRNAKSFTLGPAVGGAGAGSAFAVPLGGGAGVGDDGAGAGGAGSLVGPGAWAAHAVRSDNPKALTRDTARS
ncbi:MAG: hypothetical protein DYH12_34360 [Sorangiineae bacterium PRO1]|nr:hypothetical protein [Sorangiineae bacterium PRO1]